MKLNSKHHILVYADNVNILTGSVHTIKKNTETLLVASKQMGENTNAGRTKYMVKSRDQNVGRTQYED